MNEVYEKKMGKEETLKKRGGGWGGRKEITGFYEERVTIMFIRNKLVCVVATLVSCRHVSHRHELKLIGITKTLKDSVRKEDADNKRKEK